MANLPEKNVVLVDKITNVPTDSNLFINANGEFKQASVNDVVNSSTVVSTAVETAINTAVQDSIDSNFKQTSGSPILLTDSAEGVLTDFKAYGKSVQDGEPTPDSPQAIKSVADGGYFDGELLGGYYDGSGVFVYGSNTTNVGNKNPIPCKGGDVIKIIYEESISAITVALYDENMMFIDRPYKLNTNEFVITAPSNAKYMNFHLSAEYIITPTTAKPITVTINGKYAFIVKSKGKNLLENTATSQTINGVTFAVNEDKSVTVNGTSNAWVNILLGSIKMTSNLTLSSETVGTSNGNAKIQFYNATKSLQITELSNGSYDYNNSNGDTIEVWTRIAPSVTVSNLTFYPMIRPVGTDVTYEPYKETVTYIPLNEPLRSVGNVTDEVSPTEVTRRFKEVVFDGSSDEAWNIDTNGYFYILRSDFGLTKPSNNNILCSHFRSWSSSATDNIIGSGSDYGIYIFCSKFSAVDEWKTWLQANPITVVYELAEPIVEAIEPVDIVTYDNVTYLTASDNADMEIEYPTTKVAGIASIGYSKGIKAEYETEQLKKQLLEIQATIVNTL